MKDGLRISLTKKDATATAAGKDEDGVDGLDLDDENTELPPTTEKKFRKLRSSRELKENQSLSHAAYHRQTYADSFFPDKKLLRADKNDDEDDEDEDDEADDDDDDYSSEGSWTSGSDSDECSEDDDDYSSEGSWTSGSDSDE